MSKPWQSYWLVEALRLKESQWGPVEDAVEVRRAIAAGGSFEQRLLLRAQLIAQRSGWPDLQVQLIKALRLSLGLLSALLRGFGHNHRPDQYLHCFGGFAGCAHAEFFVVGSLLLYRGRQSIEPIVAVVEQTSGERFGSEFII